VYIWLECPLVPYKEKENEGKYRRNYFHDSFFFSNVEYIKSTYRVVCTGRISMIRNHDYLSNDSSHWFVKQWLHLQISSQEVWSYYLDLARQEIRSYAFSLAIMSSILLFMCPPLLVFFSSARCISLWISQTLKFLI
jgi:hypothetical protein